MLVLAALNSVSQHKTCSMIYKYITSKSIVLTTVVVDGHSEVNNVFSVEVQVRFKSFSAVASSHLMIFAYAQIEL